MHCTLPSLQRAPRRRVPCLQGFPTIPHKWGATTTTHPAYAFFVAAASADDSPAIVPRVLRRARRPRGVHAVRADMPGDPPAWSLPPPRASCAVTACCTYVPCTPAAAFARRTIVPRTSSPRTSPAPLVHPARSAFNTPLSSRRGPCCGFPRVGTSFAHAVQPVSSTCRSVQGTSDMSPNSCASDVRPSFILFCHHHAHLPPVRLLCGSAAPTHRARSLTLWNTRQAHCDAVLVLPRELVWPDSPGRSR